MSLAKAYEFTGQTAAQTTFSLSSMEIWMFSFRLLVQATVDFNTDPCSLIDCLNILIESHDVLYLFTR